MLEDYRKDKDMIADHVPPEPHQALGVGYSQPLRALREEKRLKVRLALLPRGVASVTSTGIQFKGAEYICERAKKGRVARRSENQTVEDANIVRPAQYGLHFSPPRPS